MLAALRLEFAIKTECSQAWEPWRALQFTIGQPRNLEKTNKQKNMPVFSISDNTAELLFVHVYCIPYNQPPFGKS